MIKLVVSDVDGTLLKSGESEIPEEALRVIHELKEKGVLFAAASGRPYADLKHLFGKVAEDIAFIASDGAFISYKSQAIAKFPIEKETGFEFMREIYMETDAEVALYGAYMSYIIPKRESFAAYFRNTVRGHIETVSCMHRVEDEYLKIGIFHEADVEKHAGAIASYWNGRLHPVYSSKNWLEYTAAGVHKGAGLDKLIKTFDIAPEEVLAFGDNQNDREMLELAGCSYAMSRAPQEIKRLCGYETQNPVETIRALVL
ncbi:MAG: HAD family phosphatase [Lachnospiraceae bacterium]|nr:HAD family phosphatase [Lachnospiraceae bacterium]